MKSNLFTVSQNNEFINQLETEILLKFHKPAFQYANKIKPESPIPFPSFYTGLVGLRNLGLTCYMNAALQALSNSMPLAHFMIECPAFLRTDRKTPGLARPFQRLMLEMWHRKRPSFVTPSVLYHGFKQVQEL